MAHRSSLSKRYVNVTVARTEDQLLTVIARASKITWTSDLFYVISLCWSKLSVACLFRRFSAQPERIRNFSIFIYAVCVYGVVGLLITALRENILHPWRYNEETAQSNLDRWIAFGVMGAVLDVIALVCPFYLIWGIQIDRRSKARVVLAFASRAPAIVFTVLRLVSISRLSGNDFTWTYVTPEVYTQLELHYSLIAATIPCLRIFLKAWNTSFLAMGLEDLDEQAYVERECFRPPPLFKKNWFEDCMNDMLTNVHQTRSRKEHTLWVPLAIARTRAKHMEAKPIGDLGSDRTVALGHRGKTASPKPPSAEGEKTEIMQAKTRKRQSLLSTRLTWTLDSRLISELKEHTGGAMP